MAGTPLTLAGKPQEITRFGSRGARNLLAAPSGGDPANISGDTLMMRGIGSGRRIPDSTPSSLSIPAYLRAFYALHTLHALHDFHAPIRAAVHAAIRAAVHAVLMPCLC